MHAHTVEVVATFGDGVVAVRHLTAERRSLLTTALIAIGAVSLAVAIAGFLWATHTASVNDTARDRWLDRGHPPWAFRPKTLPGDLDVIFLGGAFLGLAALTAGLARRRPRGPDDGIRLSRDGLALRLPTGDVVPVSEHTRLRVLSGSVVFHVATVGAPPELDRDLVGDRRALAFIAASVVAHLALLPLLRVPVRPPPTAPAEPIVVPPARAETEAAATESGGGGGSGGGSGAASMTLTSSEPRARATAPRGHGILGTDIVVPISVLTGSTDITTGMGALDADLLAIDLHRMAGFGGGPSGGGYGLVPGASIGVGRYGTLDHGEGTGEAYGVGGGRCGSGCRGRTAAVPTVRIGQPEGCTGDCEKSLLRRAIRGCLPKIRYCYEKHLLTDPTLAGTVTTTFVLTPEGAVLEITATGVSDGVALCIRDVVTRIKFPRFESLLSITYPFHFRRAGE